MSSGFKIASGFSNAAAVVNGISGERFSVLLGRVIQKLHLKNARLFSKEEEDQLKEKFQLSDEELRLTLDVSCYIFEQAAFTSTDPEKLYRILLEGGFDETHGKIIGRLWATEAAEYINKLKGQTLGYDNLLNVDYHINMVMGQSSLARLQEPTAFFEFSVAKTDQVSKKKDSGIESAKKVEKICLEFSQDELFTLFNDLDRIQKQLDALT